MSVYTIDERKIILAQVLTGIAVVVEKDGIREFDLLFELQPNGDYKSNLPIAQVLESKISYFIKYHFYPSVDYRLKDGVIAKYMKRSIKPYNYFADDNGIPSIPHITPSQKIIIWDFEITYPDNLTEPFQLHRVFGGTNEWLGGYDRPQGLEDISGQLRKLIEENNLP